MRTIISDPIYRILKTVAERKQVFRDYIEERRKEERVIFYFYFLFFIFLIF